MADRRAGERDRPRQHQAGRAQRAARAAADRGRPVLFVTDTAEDLRGVEVVVWDGDLAIPAALVDVAGPLVAWSS